MSLGLCLVAELAEPAATPEKLLSLTSDWLKTAYHELRPKLRIGESDGTAALFCTLHPAAEEVEITCADPAHLVVSANTTTVGPGYHIFLTSLLQAWAKEFSASWLEPDKTSDEFGDDTGYFFTGNEEELRDEMSWWLQAVSGTFFDDTFEPEDLPIAFCLPMNPQFENGQAAITPLGPRDRSWLRKTHQDGRNGKDFFAWWDSGLTASYYLGRALTHMWSNVRWRSPLNDSEREVWDDVVSSLRSAHGIDPTLDYPWAEWNQILELLGAQTEEREWLQPYSKLHPIVGYRRGNVRVSLPGGWTIKVPGSFSDFDVDRDGNLSAVDPPREIWFTAFQSKKPDSPKAWKSQKREFKANHPDLFVEEDDYVAQARITRKDPDSDDPYFILQSSAVCPGKRAVCTVVFSQEADKNWAIETWRSLRPPSTDHE